MGQFPSVMPCSAGMEQACKHKAPFQHGRSLTTLLFPIIRISVCDQPAQTLHSLSQTRQFQTMGRVLLRIPVRNSFHSETTVSSSTLSQGLFRRLFHSSRRRLEPLLLSKPNGVKANGVRLISFAKLLQNPANLTPLISNASSQRRGPHPSRSRGSVPGRVA